MHAEILFLPASALLSLNAASPMLTKITSTARLTALPKPSTANPLRVRIEHDFLHVSDVNFSLLRVVKEGEFKQDNDHRYS
jgi:hypothetical protein